MRIVACPPSPGYGGHKGGRGIAALKQTLMPQGSTIGAIRLYYKIMIPDLSSVALAHPLVQLYKSNDPAIATPVYTQVLIQRSGEDRFKEITTPYGNKLLIRYAQYAIGDYRRNYFSAMV